MTQTREDRIFRHYTKLRRGRPHRHMRWPEEWRGVSLEIWLPLARTWRMPIREVKAIVAEEKERRRS